MSKKTAPRHPDAAGHELRTTGGTQGLEVTVRGLTQDRFSGAKSGTARRTRTWLTDFASLPAGSCRHEGRRGFQRIAQRYQGISSRPPA